MSTLNTVYPTIESFSEGFAFFSDGSKKAIRKNDEDKEFVRLNNPRSKKPFHIYTNCVKDALEDVVNGYGHLVLMSDSLFGKSISVIHFLDEEYGEIQRQKMIKEFEGTVFGYHIRVMNKKSLGSSFVYEGDTFNIRFFENEEEVNNFINKTNEEAIALAKRFTALNESKSEDIQQEYKQIIENYSDIVQLLAFGISDGDESNYLEPIQAIKH